MFSKIKISKLKLLLVAVIAVCIFCFFYFGLNEYLNLEFIKAQESQIREFYSNNFLLTIFLFFSTYVVVTALSLPGAAILTLLSGYLFSFFIGTIIVSIASVLGATCAFLVSRFLFKDWIQGRFGDKLKLINEGMRKDGNFYLFTIRLIPIFPFFIINLVMGLTPIKTWSFTWVSAVGMLPSTMIFVNVGSQLSQLDSIKGILSVPMILSFVALAAFPWCVKAAMKFINKKRGV